MPRLARSRTRIELLADDEVRVLAGRAEPDGDPQHAAQPSALLVDINGIDGLDAIAVKDGQVEIGALVRHAQAERSAEIARHAPLIAAAMPHIGHPAIRNRGTIGGSIAFADPAAELPACLMALDGEVDIAGPAGARTGQGRRFLQGPVRDRARAARVLTAIRIPGGGRRHALRVCGIRAPARRLCDGGPRRLRTRAKAAISPMSAWRSSGSARPRCARAMPRPRSPRGDIDAAVTALGKDLDPPDDVQATGAVKGHLAGVLLRRVAAQLAGARR